MSASTTLESLRGGQQQTQAPARPRTLGAMLASDAAKQQIALALPRHMTADRLARIALTEVRKVPKLAEADPVSLLGAVIQCAQLGLEPGNALGHAYLLPFDKREKINGQWKTVATEVQLIIGYRGMIDLARRSGQIMSLEARPVYAGDTFQVRYGLDAELIHVPDFEGEPGELKFVYAVAHLKDGGKQFEVMSRRDVEAIRSRSKAKDSGPWSTDYEAMAKKSVLRRLFKLLPVSIELQRAVGLDEQADAGVLQSNAALLDVEYAHVERGQPHELVHEHEHTASPQGPDPAGDDAPPPQVSSSAGPSPTPETTSTRQRRSRNLE